MMNRSEKDARRIEIYVDDLIICNSTLLIMDNRRAEAIELLHEGKRVCKFIPSFQHGKTRIKIMLASLNRSGMSNDNF